MPSEIRQHIKVFISYKKRGEAVGVPHEIYKWLIENGFDVFFDEQRIDTGEDWATKIRDNVRTSDVVLLLLEPDSIKSEWVQREVDMAFGANITVLPLTLMDFNEAVEEDRIKREKLMKEAQHKLAIYERQYSYYKKFLSSSPIERLRIATHETRKAQRRMTSHLSEQRHPLPLDFDPHYRTFRLDGNQSGGQIHIAYGDMLRIRNIGVIVNSENTYMQMARHFESNTLSSQLRYAGALTDEYGQIIEDTVQDDLNEWIAWNWGTNRVRRPYALAKTVIPTRAGHPDGVLHTTTGAQYIFHAASVEIVANPEPGAEWIAPIYRDKDIMELVQRCLDLLVRLNKKQGRFLDQKAQSARLHLHHLPASVSQFSEPGMAVRACRMSSGRWHASFATIFPTTRGNN